MAIAANGRPPFRADHIGSLLRPRKLRDAFRAHAEGKLDERAFRAVAGRSDPRGGEAAGGLRPAGGDRRRVPAHLLLGEVRAPDQGPRRQGRGVQVPRRARPQQRLHRALRDGEGGPRRADHAGRVPLRRAAHQGDAQGDDARALDHALLPLHAVRRTGNLRERARVLRRPGQGVPGGDRRPRARGLPLRAARRGGARGALRSRRAGEGARRRRQSRTRWSTSTWMRSTRR